MEVHLNLLYFRNKVTEQYKLQKVRKPRERLRASAYDG